MATFSEIKIKFTQDLNAGAQFGFNYVNSGGTFGTPISVNLIWNWFAIRSSVFQVGVGTPTAFPGERTAINFMAALILDQPGGFIITRSVNEVKIRYQNSGIYGVVNFSWAPVIYDFDIIGGGLVPVCTSDESIEVITQNETEVFAVESITFSQASSNPCQNIKVSIQTTTQADTVFYPVNITTNTDNPIEFNWPRNTQFLFSAMTQGGDSINTNYNTPILLNSANFNIGILNGPNGSTVTVTNNNSQILQLQYSMNGVTWQDSNIFTGLNPGTYKLYVRDLYGCSFDQTFTVSAYQETYNPFFYISKSNSLRFAKRINFSDSSNYKNDENTLSFEESVKLPYKYIQQFNSGDVITTQFKSNYTTNEVNVLKDNNSTDAVSITQISQNIGVKDKREAFMAASGSNTVIYFIAGTIYDYVTNSSIGNYALNGSLPIWGKVGNYVSVDGGFYLIEDIYFDEVLNADVLVIDAVAPSNPTIKIVSCIFNVEDYEVFEFSIDMANYIDQNIKVRINSNHESWTELIHLSEDINVQVNQFDTVEIKYWNSDNTDVFYSSNIRHRIRPEITNVGGINEQDQENYKTDSNIKLINADVYEGDEFIFEPATKEIMRKLLIALSHEFIFINNVGYVKNDNIDVEGPLGDSNLYVVKVKMLKNGNVYNSQSLGISSDVYNGSNEQIVGLITTEDGFLKYQ